MTVRVRYAPSPTGALHIGAARTVLFNFLFARHHGGKFILRIEDTDRSRYAEGSLATILEGIRWLGMQWDEGPEVGGPYAPYFQSERLSIYRAELDRLLAAGDAYPCFCTPARLTELREEQAREHKQTRYDRRCLGLDPAEVASRLAAGETHAIRMRVPEGRTVVHDLLRGPLEFENSSQDDQVLLKSDGFPTYHLAATVDDHLMAISHVFRGDEWLASFPKHVMLYRMLGWEPPAFVHLPLVLGPDKAKLSKRHGAAPVLDYREMGYLPEAVDNFLALLGWSPGSEQEIFSLEELGVAFDVHRIQPSPAIFDQTRLDHVNGEHIRLLIPAQLAKEIRPFVPSAVDDDLLARATPLIQTRIQRLTEAEALLRFLVEAPVELPPDLVPRLKGIDDEAERGRQTLAVLRQVRALFETSELGPGLDGPVRELAERVGWKAGDVFMTIRIALTGTRVTPPILESAALLGRDETLRRLDRAAATLEKRLP